MIEDLVKKRLHCKFLSGSWSEGKSYDCITFAASVYKEAGLLDESFSGVPEHKAFGNKEQNKKTLFSELKKLKNFSFAVGPVKSGDLVVLAVYDRGPHAGIILENRRIAHCVHSRGVCIDTFTSEMEDSILMICRPDQNESLRET
jgi:cell wall-associated NlpC family hydrolase